MKIEIPKTGLVLLVGPSGSGKSTFAKKRFLPTEIVSSDHCRAMICDDENNQKASGAAFGLLFHITKKRLEWGRLTVIDATNVKREDRRQLIKMAKKYYVGSYALILEVPLNECLRRNEMRESRRVPVDVIKRQYEEMERGLKQIEKEGFRRVFTLSGAQEVENAEIVKIEPPCNRKEDNGPFDIIGDLHGCLDELLELLFRLGYRVDDDPDYDLKYRVVHPEGRRVIFLGDYVDRGPKIPDTLRLVMSMKQDGKALCLIGNHDRKYLRSLKGHNVKVAHGFGATLSQMENESENFRNRIREFIEDLDYHYVLDIGRLVVAHAGLKEEMHGRDSKSVRMFAIYGETTGETDEKGMPVRKVWARRYSGDAFVVYGHMAVKEAVWINKTIDVDTGCVMGGKLTALRYPEMETVQVDAERKYYESGRPLVSIEEL